MFNRTVATWKQRLVSCLVKYARVIRHPYCAVAVNCRGSMIALLWSAAAMTPCAAATWPSTSQLHFAPPCRGLRLSPGGMATAPPQPLPMPDSGRLGAIILLKDLREHYFLSDESRDLAVQLFDAFLAEQDQKTCVDGLTLIVACLVIATKLLEFSESSLTMRHNFLSHDDNRRLERQVLSTLRFNIFPAQTPSFLVHHLIGRWPESMRLPFLVHACDVLIGKFWEHEESATFSHVVVAITAILLGIGKEVPSLNPQIRLQSDFVAFLDIYGLQTTLSSSPFTLIYCNADVDRCLHVFTTAADPNYGRCSPESVMMSAQASVLNSPTTTIHRPKAIRRTNVPLLTADTELDSPRSGQSKKTRF